MSLAAADLLDLACSLAGRFFASVAYPWEILPRIGEIIGEIARGLPGAFAQRQPGVWVGAGTRIEASVLIEGPAIIGCGCQLRHGAYLRENVILGDGCIVGNSTEVKNAILFDRVQANHFNYVGDSVLGAGSHLGAGAILSNVRLDGRTVRVRCGDGVVVETLLAKFGAILGDRVEIGCNAVVNPGTVIGRETLVHPLANVAGVVAPKSVVRRDGSIAARRP